MANAGTASDVTFYWYDYETFGTDKKRDRPAQFGGFRTDANFRRKSKDLLIYCSPADDYLPHPEACLLTGITPLMCLTEGEPEAVFANKIYKEFKEPNSIVLGYNNLKFDDEVSRFMFWRNLINPYDREYGEGRARMDMFTVIKALYAFKPDTLNWPHKDNGSVSMKLEELTKVNGLVHDHAHDALSDARATALLAKKIKDTEPKFWEYAVSLSNKENVQKLLDSQTALLVVADYSIPATKNLRLLFPILKSGKEYLCWDLTADPTELPQLKDSDLEARTNLTAEEREAGKNPLPFVSISANKYPFIVKASPFYRNEFEQMFSLSRTELAERTKFLKEMDKGFVGNLYLKLNEIRRERFEGTQPKDEDVETALYSGGFVSDQDRRVLDELRAMNEFELSEKSLTKDYQYKGMDKLIRRFISRNYPEAMTEQDSADWYLYKSQHLIRGANGSRTFEEYFKLLDELADRPNVNMELIEELREYGEGLQEDLQ
ncbi:exodeoxyribonuclease I [Turicimonas muris]|uniref:Exodeoxyribonuclease I n=4 Tax=Turicimonas muris TaxID=1796652 RepID=A0A227KR43_9BURK|nr:exodeoxyribonuclease I [Turicimonas muris]ANU65174.1 exodeoxyribonuclease I [Burkholderiales bacterium YL45]OXE50979.1 exodeoxyribonuclease I [Turicimonas muris]QQQ96332.1 exodeoxyribonuclease I [Turicimonas muris]